MKPDLVVKNAKVVNSLGTYEGHILIKDGQVLATASRSPSSTPKGCTSSREWSTITFT